MTTTVRADLGDVISRWLGERVGEDVTITAVERIPGGASMATYRLRCAGGPHPGYVLRVSPDGALLATERGVEHAAYESFTGTGVPVPTPIGLEPSPELMGAPFFVATEVTGCDADPRLLEEEPWSSTADELGRQFWTILGEIAHTDPGRTSLGAVLPAATAERSAGDQLEHWARVLRDDEVVADPLAAAAVAALSSHPPPAPPRVSIVHGDYRSGNVLFDRSGHLRAVLDWEMCHLGDPLEDVAWALSPLWAGATGVPGRMLDRSRALAHWEVASGRRVDREGLRWWELFTAVKGTAIWASAAHRYVTGQSTDLLLAHVPWMAGVRQEHILARTLRDFLEARA